MLRKAHDRAGMPRTKWREIPLLFRGKEERAGMTGLHDLITGNEGWLIDRILRYASDRGFMRYTTSLKELWRASVIGLSASLLVELARCEENPPELDAEEDYSNDALSAFCVLEARRHCERGVPLGLFVSLFKGYRQAYRELILNAEFSPDSERRALLFIDRCFDRMELAICSGWERGFSDTPEEHERLRRLNMSLVCEKNKMYTVFESLADPALVVDREGKVGAVNFSAVSLLKHGNPVCCGLYPFSVRPEGSGSEESKLIGMRAGTLFPWLETELAAFLDGNARVWGFETRIGENSRCGSVVDVRLSRMLDPAGKHEGAVVTVRDVTDRYRAQEEAARERERPAATLRSIGDGVVAADTEGRVVFLNQTAEKLTGWSEEEGAGIPLGEVFRLYGEETGEPYDDIVSKAMGGGFVVHSHDHAVLRSRNDARIPVAAHGAAVRNASGDATGIVLVFRDVSEQRVMEAVLEKSRNFYLSLLEDFPALIWRCNTETRCDYFNKTWLGFTGRTMEQELGYGWTEGLHPDDYKGCVDGFLEAFGRRESFLLEYRMRRYDGEYRWIMDYGRPFCDLDGNFAGYIGSCYDVTENRTTREAQRRLAVAVDHVAEGIILLDHEKNILYLNPAMEQMCGREGTQLIGQRASALKSDRHTEAFYDSIWKTAEEEGFWIGNVEGLHEDGSLVETETSVSVVRDDSGQIVYYVYVVRDLTVEKGLERQLQQAQKMEAIGTLAGGIAHDFNNILSAVMGYTELALYDTRQDTPINDHLKQVLQAGNRAKDLVKQILAFSRQSSEEKKSILISPIAREALRLLRASLPTTVEIRRNIGTNVGPVLGDPVQIHQVLMNLCANSAHAMRDTGGILTVTLEEESGTVMRPVSGIVVGEFKPGTYVRLSVGDTGHGMDHKIMERIFDPFFTTKRPGEGTGMGLSVVQGIIRGLDGVISVESELGVGTTFRIYLPRCDAGAEVLVESTEPLPRGSARVLLVDDEEPLVQLGKRMLERLGYDVTTSIDSMDALERFRACEGKNFDLVITDQTMPRLTGVKMATEMLGIRPGVPILLCTGFSESVRKEDAERLGFKAILMKPLVIRELAQAVHRALNAGKKRLSGDTLVG